MDCMTALTLDPLYVKAYLRLGSAQFFMKKLQKAKDTFDKVLQLEPQNKQAKLEIEKIEKVCRFVDHDQEMFLQSNAFLAWWFMPVWSCTGFLVSYIF